MKLPANVARCMDALEAAGFACYAVGGCVRDAVLGLTPHDYDLCTAALPAETEAVFADRQLVLAGKKHGTVGVVTGDGVVEITTFRREGGYRDNRHPDWVRFVPDLREDLARRDFTVNAMAYSPTRGFADPFGGREDLRRGILRAVGDPETRFREDALRILRGARFSARFSLTPDVDTMAAMERLAPLLDTLARERVFEEMSRLLTAAGREDLLRFRRIVAAAVAELGPTLDFDQHSPHHRYDLFTHIASVTAAVPPELSLRWAALLHDVGKPAVFRQDGDGRGHFPDHAAVGAAMAEEILRRLRAPTALRERAVLLIGQHMTVLTPERPLLLRRLRQYGPEAVRQLLALQRADDAGKGVDAHKDYFDETEKALDAVLKEDGVPSLKNLALNGRDLLALGLPKGPAVGRCLEWLLTRVQEDALPNDRPALLAAARDWAEKEGETE